MNITSVFFLGFIIAFLGVIPPGLLNMTAAKISLKEGHIRGVIFSIGVSITLFFQTYIATIFSRYLSNHLEIIEILQQVAFIIFILITIYYLFLAKPNTKQQIKPKIKSKHSRFFHGLFLSAINIFPIPYQAYMTITVASFGWFNFEKTSILSYVSGATTGTFVMLYFYIFFFDKVKNKHLTSQKNMNYIIGCITAIIAITTFINILKKY